MKNRACGVAPRTDEPRGASVFIALACAIVTGAVLGYADGFAQEIVRVEDVVECPRCAIVLEEVITLGVPDGPGMIESERMSAIRDARGRYYLHPNYGSRIVVYDADGAYRRTIGRRGGGPGEFERISAVRVGSGDTLYVFDAEHLRVTTYSPEHELISTQRLPVPPGMAVERLPDGAVVFASSVRTPDLAGLPLHLVTPDGVLAASFGSIRGEYRADMPSMTTRALGVDARGKILSLHRARYLIDTWAPNGTLERRIERAGAWFESGSRGAPDAAVPPAPVPLAVREDDRGRLWVMMRVAGENWREGVEGGAGLHAVVTDIQAYYDTYMEVIDPARGVLIARHRVPQILGNFVDDGLVGTVVFDAYDVPYFRVWRVRLIEPEE